MTRATKRIERLTEGILTGSDPETELFNPVAVDLDASRPRHLLSLSSRERAARVLCAQGDATRDDLFNRR